MDHVVNLVTTLRFSPSQRFSEIHATSLFQRISATP